MYTSHKCTLHTNVHCILLQPAMNTMDFCFEGNFRCSPDNEQLFSSLVCNSNPLNSEGLS